MVESNQCFLDFEYASIRQGRHDTATIQPEITRGVFAETPYSNALQQLMKDKITGALIKEHGLEGFHPVCTGAERLLSGPKEVGLRELELKLILEGKVGNIRYFDLNNSLTSNRSRRSRTAFTSNS